MSLVGCHVLPELKQIEAFACLLWCGRIACLVCGALFAVEVTPASSAPAPGVEEQILPSGNIAFDIPAQPLATALEAYSVTAGRDVVYNGKLALGRQSAAIRGSFTPDTALQMLLEGSGLAARYMAADAFVLVPAATGKPSLFVNAAPSAVVLQYYGLVQAGLRQAFCSDGYTQPGRYRLAVSFWIGHDGKVSRAELLGTTGAGNLDASIERTLRSVEVGAPPPNGFAQPITLIVMPQSHRIGRDCSPVGTRLPAVGGDP